MKKIFKNITTKKVIFGGVLLTFSIFIILEIINISTDIYNLNQIERIKNILKISPKNTYKFLNITDFNNQFKSKTHLKNGCLDLTQSDITQEGYAIGYLYKSYLFKIINLKPFYSSFDASLSSYMLCKNGGCYPTHDYELYLKNQSNGCW